MIGFRIAEGETGRKMVRLDIILMKSHLISSQMKCGWEREELVDSGIRLSLKGSV